MGGGVLVPRDVFDIAMDVMNGAAIPPQYQVHTRECHPHDTE